MLVIAKSHLARNGRETERDRTDSTGRARSPPWPRSTAPADAATSGQPDVGGRDAPLGVEHTLEHRRVRFGEAGLHDGEERLGVGTAVVDLAREPAVGHGDEALGAHVRAGTDRAGAPHQHGGEEERVVAAEHGEVARRAGEDLERVGVERADGLLHPGDVGVRGELEHPGGPEVASGADRDVVDRRPVPGSRRRRRGSARPRRLRTAARSTAPRSGWR